MYARNCILKMCATLLVTYACEKEHTDYTVRKHIEMGEKLKERMQRFGYTLSPITSC